MRIYSVFQRMQNSAILALVGAAGLLATVLSLRTPSEAESSFLFGYSILRVGIGMASLIASAIFLMGSAAALKQPGWWKRLSGWASAVINSNGRAFALIALLFALFAGFAALLLLAVSPAALELVILKTILNHLGILLLWGVLTVVLTAVLIFQNFWDKAEKRGLFSLLRLAILFSIALAVYVGVLEVYMKYTWDIRMRHLEEYIFLPALIFLVWGLVDRYFQERAWYPAVIHVIQLLALGIVTYTIYSHMAQWMEWQNTPSKAYWHELADAFLQGRLYLINPSTTHDLTLYKGNWYVPNPPLPALVFLPFVAIWGVNINTVVFSIVIGSINTVLVFIMLEQASRLELIPTRSAANLLITAVFALGSPHWWLSMMGRVWFISQLLTLTFSILAVLLILRKSSPWWVGACLGLAMLSRPNVFTLWPFLLGLALYQMQQTHGKFDWKRSLSWAIQSAVPVCLAVAAQLGYNYIRFGDFFDFGYVTINSADWLMTSVRTYGMFNIHFIPANLQMMFLKMPLIEMRGSCLYFSPSREGFSMVAMTPAIIYMFRRLKWNWWTIGAWTSVILSIALLALYHNNGAWQLGYRYLMDFILPVLLLMAVGVGKRASFVYRILAVLSFLFTIAGIIWWFEKWWC